MQLLEGETLKHRIAGRPFATDEILDIGIQRDGGVWRTPVAGGEETEVLGGAGWWWTLSRTGLYLISGHGGLPHRNSEMTLRFFDFASGMTTELFREVSPPRYWRAASADEHWILYSESPTWTSELMLVENFQ